MKIRHREEISLDWAKRSRDILGERTGALLWWVFVIMSGVIGCLAIIWLSSSLFSGKFLNLHERDVDATNLAVFSSIAGFLIAALIFVLTDRIQKFSQYLLGYLARSWAGTQTDYGAGLVSSRQDAPKEVVFHLDDIERGFLVPNDIDLDEVNLVVSSLAYGIEHSPETLGRFLKVLKFVTTHPQTTNNNKRKIRIAIWPELEHQVIWGAKRSLLTNEFQPKLADTPSVQKIVGNDTLVNGNRWDEALPNWCESKKRTWETIKCLQELIKVFEHCRNYDRRIEIEINEIEQWSGRAFFAKYGANQYFTHYIATTPISSSTLCATHWTTMGFTSQNSISYRQLRHIYDTCVLARYSDSEATSSQPNVDPAIETQNSDAVVRVTRQFLERPAETLGRYFLLPDGWEKWKKFGNEFCEFDKQLAPFRKA
ncbi:hypothetical protein [Qipengyuania sp. ASV99]|uniref:hypothetical protein n=1 Tax=Qipengyuania sp. ASV99 TaxID=3399681 RepID=UPI003A4C7E8B